MRLHSVRQGQHPSDEQVRARPTGPHRPLTTFVVTVTTTSYLEVTAGDEGKALRKARLELGPERQVGRRVEISHIEEAS